MAKNIECEHYQRRCALKGPCCNKVYVCRFCHDNIEDHSLDRKSVQTVKCLQCEKEQDVSSTCASCGISFGLYSCLICRLFDDRELGQFHCNECGICRVGGQENFFHCPSCAICLGMKQKDSHKCINEGSRNNCPVCMEDIHSSRIPSQIVPCGHFLHTTCFRSLVSHGNYSCPLCNRSITDMSSVWRQLDQDIGRTPMPEDYKNAIVEIKCRDCQKDSKTKFHIIGHKCQHCGSYNTSQEKIEGLPEVAVPIPIPNIDDNTVNNGDNNDADNNVADNNDAINNDDDNNDDDEWTTEEEFDIEEETVDDVRVVDLEQQDDDTINTDNLSLD